MKGKDMRSKQRGMTLIGFVIGLIVACFFAYMAMILGPAYSEYFGVRKAMNFVAQNTTPTTSDKNMIARMLNKQFNVGYVENVEGKDVQLIREKGGNLILMEYEVRKGFAYNIDFIIKFTYQVELGDKDAGE
jgi:Tfp pilus assembly major pilin PilA